MCLILFSHKLHPDYPLILAANRDEFFNRPTAPLDFWEDDPNILAGRDQVGNGTWLGITRDLRLAAITNYRDPNQIKSNAPSRGNLVLDFLQGRQSPREYLSKIQPASLDYNGFNLLVGAGNQVWYYSNYEKKIRKVSQGLHGLSNHLLDTPWPKVERGKSLLGPLFSRPKLDEEAVFQALADQSVPPVDQLPDTGIGPAWERILSPMFIHSPFYGTRCSSLLAVHRNGTALFVERSYSPQKKEILSRRAFQL